MGLVPDEGDLTAAEVHHDVTGIGWVPSESAENSRSPGWIWDSGTCGPSCRQPKVVRAMRMPSAA
jgi:hypothetical protein